MAVYRKDTFELLDEAAKASTSVSGVLRYLGLTQAGGTHTHVSRTLKKLGVDTSHFIRYQNGAARVRLTPGQILVRSVVGAPRAKTPLLRRALSEIGRPYQCEGCGNDGFWCGAPLQLEIDHIDGNFHDNRGPNLRFLCPNCHAQTTNFSGRSCGKYGQTRSPRRPLATDKP